MKRAIGNLALASLVFAATPALAQPSETDKSLAQSLFEQGKRLMDSGKYAEACPKLAESQRLDPAGGTLLNLALCHEKAGKIATAWTQFKEALGAARRDGRQDRIAAAEQHIAALEPKLPWLTLSVPNPAEGQKVELDGAAIGEAAWGTPVSIDPGRHELNASAPGRVRWSGRVMIAVGEKQTVTVPELQHDPNSGATPATAGAAPAAPVAPSPQLEADTGGGSKTAGWILAGVGVASLGVGGYFGLQTLSKKKESDELCPTDESCSNKGVEYNDQAHTYAWITNIGIGVGIAGVGLGSYLLLSGGGSDQGESARGRRLSADASLLPGGGRLTVAGSW